VSGDADTGDDPPRSAAEAPRLLGRVIGYVDHPARAMRREPEALSEDDQQRVSDRAEQTARERRAQALSETRTRIGRELEWTEARSRYLRRELARLDRRLT
jgi:hypothetical protein